MSRETHLEVQGDRDCPNWDWSVVPTGQSDPNDGPHYSDQAATLAVLQDIRALLSELLARTPVKKKPRRKRK